MSTEVNRAARRSEARKAKNRKTGMVALSLMATTSLMSSYVSLLRTETSFAAADTSNCTAGIDELTLDVSGSRTQDVERINELQTELDDAIVSGAPEDCVTVTFSASGADKVLNFSAIDIAAYHEIAYLEAMASGPYDPRIFFIGGEEGITFDFSFEAGYVYQQRYDLGYSPIQTNLPLEIHNLTFQNSRVSNLQEGARGGVIDADDFLTVIDSEFINNTVIGGFGGAIFANDFAVISNTTFRDNTAEGMGGAVRVEDSATITGSTFEDNSAGGYSYGNIPGQGGAVWAYSEISIYNTNFVDNFAAGDGGAVYLDYASYSGEGSSGIVASTFTLNEANDDGGAVFVGDGYGEYVNVVNSQVLFTVINSRFEDNYSGSKGGAMELDSYTYVGGSTFIDNTADSDGGAIYADDEFVTVVNSGFIDNESYSQGGAIYFDDNNSFVYYSSFDGNSSEIEGGAIYADENNVNIAVSTFTNNYSGTVGGAIYFEDSDNSISNSTFVSNSAGFQGGAIFLDDYDVQVSNSTFVSNSAREHGGAIWADTGNRFFFNTFLNNLSDSDAGPGDKQSYGESISVGEGYIVGNIFAGDSQYPQIDLWNGWYELAYNLSTTNDFDFGDLETNRNVSLADLELDSEVRDNESELPVQTLSLGSSSSAAYGFVPFDTAEGALGDTPRDQRGVIRSAAFVNAGAFEGFITRTAPSVLSPASFYVVNVVAASPKAGAPVTVSGLDLKKVTEVYVGEIKVKITKSSDGELSFKLPKTMTGPVQIRFVGAGHEHIHTASWDFSTVSVVGDKAQSVVPGFASNSTKLSRAMKNEIKAFVEANSALKSVTCKGFTSAPATAQDLRLARERGQVTCDYIKKLNPALDVKVLAGAHTNTPGQQVRRVRIEMS